MKKIASTIGMGALSVLLAGSVGLSGVVMTFTARMTPALLGAVAGPGGSETDAVLVTQSVVVPAIVPSGSPMTPAGMRVPSRFTCDCAAIPCVFKVHLDANGDLWGRLKALEDAAQTHTPRQQD